MILIICIIDPNSIMCIDDNCTTIKKLDYLASICDNNKFNELAIDKMLAVMNDDHLLVESK